MELPTTTFAWRRARCLADKMINSLYLLTYPPREFAVTQPGSERDRPVNFSGSVNQSFGERFRSPVRGPKGTFKVPFGPHKFSLETESAAPLAGSSQSLARTGQERETPGGRSEGAGR